MAKREDHSIGWAYGMAARLTPRSAADSADDEKEQNLEYVALSAANGCRLLDADEDDEPCNGHMEWSRDGGGGIVGKCDTCYANMSAEGFRSDVVSFLLGEGPMIDDYLHG